MLPGLLRRHSAFKILLRGSRHRASLLSVLPMLVPMAAAAQEAGPDSESSFETYVVAPISSGAITVDGRIDEPAWLEIEPLPAYTHIPTFGAPPTERTEFRIAYDSEYLYFACHSYDSEPEAILAYSMQRDETGFRSDFCSIYIDTLNDEENSVSFRVGPAGNRADAQRSNDAQQSNANWDAFWDAATTRDERGWYAEFRIPFSTVLFQSVDGRVVMGVSMLRNISRKSETHVHPAIAPGRGTFSYAMPSRMRKIVFEGLEPQGSPVYVTPYALGGGGYSRPFDDPVAGNGSESVREAGVDFRYGVTSNLTLQLTANTDFAQVEADEQQVNLTRFSLFFPEKRDFFQERVSNFEYSLGGQERLFHSRTIGLAGGAPVRIYGGGRVVGRVGEWDVGFINMQTAESEALPSENLGVARLRRRILNPNSYVGGILTSRLGSGGERNIVYGADAIFRVVGDEFLVLNWAQSFDSREAPIGGGSYGPLDRGVVRLNWERRRVEGLGYALDLSRTGEIFDPGMGFLRRRNYTTGQANLGYGWRPGPGARLYTYGVNFDGAVFRRNVDGSVETVEVGPTARLETWGRHTLTLSAPFRYENLRSGFSLPEGASVPAGIHRFVTGRLQYAAPQGDRFRTTASFEGGEFYDGRQLTVSAGPAWAPSAHLNLAANYQVDHVTFPSRNQSFTAHVARIRAQVMLSTRTSAVGFVQYNSSARAVVSNLRLRFNPREGNDFYLVWNEGMPTDRHAFDRPRPWSTDRTILLKYSHTFRFGL